MRDIPAFPVQNVPELHLQPYELTGMTLRDYFANSAAMAIVFRGGLDEDNPRWNGDERMCDAIAVNAYVMADAMLKAREVKNVN